MMSRLIPPNKLMMCHLVKDRVIPPTKHTNNIGAPAGVPDYTTALKACPECTWYRLRPHWSGTHRR
jgi:hypothetical protein